ncbi:nucleoside 2-deoxyribosyltransferase [candidate division KSB1 bacterium]|nr:nucleoside 2-deoxyribosyltransferase [candidate division KSB1 bacterium]
MIIYFCGSIAGGRAYLDTYIKIVRHLQSLGHRVPTEHIIDPNVLDAEKKLTPAQIYQRDVQWLTASDAVIAEISNPSLGVGYEIACALHIGKSVLALHERGLFISCMITGNRDPNLQVVEYSSDDEWRATIDHFCRTVERMPQLNHGKREKKMV